MATPADFALMLELSQLRCFVAAAEELHFGRAAQRLNMTQPPLSRQIQLLEHVLAVKLLDRNSRQVSLTAAGRAFLTEAHRILRMTDVATLAARRAASGEAGRVAIGFTAVSGYSFLPAIVHLALGRAPEVELELFEMVTSDQEEALLSGQIDLAFIRPPVEHASFDSCEIIRENLVAALPVGHPLRGQAGLSLQQFGGRPLVMYSRRGAGYFANLIARLFDAAGVEPHGIQQVTQIHSMLGLVQAGLAAAIVPASAMRLHVDDITQVPLLTVPAFPVELHMVWRRDNDNPVLPAMRSLCMEAARAYDARVHA